MVNEHESTTVVINKTECANSLSWRHGPSPADVAKVYFESGEELKRKIIDIKEGIKLIQE